MDAQNKFMGKSFEIRPTGVAHAELLLPESQEPSYPKYHRPGNVVEHYSWKKVTTNISGFILGSPTIDHYGDMVVCPFSYCALFVVDRAFRLRTIEPRISVSSHLSLVVGEVGMRLRSLAM